MSESPPPGHEFPVPGHQLPPAGSESAELHRAQSTSHSASPEDPRPSNLGPRPSASGNPQSSVLSPESSGLSPSSSAAGDPEHLELRNEQTPVSSPGVQSAESRDGTQQRADGGFSLWDVAITLAAYKWIVLGLPLAAGVIGAVISLVMPETFTAAARILPPQQSQSSVAAMMLGQFMGGIGGGGGVVSALGLKNPADLYVGILKSRTVTDAIIDRFKLRDKYDAKVIEDARLGLERYSRITATKDTIITIEVDDREPKVAADMANAFAEELQRLTQTVAVTEAGQRRVFFEGQLKQAKNSLTEAEFALRKTQERTGMFKLDDQGRAIIEMIAALRAQIGLKEIELRTLRMSATAQNPDYLRVEQQLTQMREQLRRMEKAGGASEGDIFVPTGKIPETGLEYLRSLRDLKYSESMFELLTKQYELARLDEAGDSSIVQVIDRAIPPERRSWPKRKLIVIIAMMLGLLLAVGIVFVSERLKRFRNDEDAQRRWRTLIELLRTRKR